MGLIITTSRNLLNRTLLIGVLVGSLLGASLLSPLPLPSHSAEDQLHETTHLFLPQDPNNADLNADRPLTLTTEVTRGQLENGLQYYVQPNDTPAEIVELRLVVRAGSIHETHSQLGVAHFVEHMAFNGTAQFPGNTIISYLEQLGSSFGAHSNAYTSFDYTVYTLKIPTNNPANVAMALQVLEQWAFHVLFEDDEIEKERGVIIEEWRRQQTAERLATNTHWRTLLPSRYAARLPIGTEESIRNVSANTIRSFYNRWYRPGRMAVVAIGDIDTQQIIADITQIFGPQPATTSRAAPPTRDYPHTSLRASVVYDKGISANTLSWYQRSSAPPETTQSYRDSIIQALFSVIINNRLEDATARPSSPLLSAGASLVAQRITAFDNAWVLRASFEPGNEQHAIAAIVNQFNQLIYYGITPQEFENSVSRLMRWYQSFWDSRLSRKSTFYASAYINHFVYEDILLPIDEEIALVESLLATIQSQDIVAEALRLLYAPNRVLTITGIALDATTDASTDIPTGNPTPTRTPTEADIIGYFNQALQAVPMRTVAHSANPASLTAGLALPQIATPIAAEEYDATLDLHTWVLTNGMQVTFKPTTLEEDEVLFDLYSKGGYATATFQNAAANTYANTQVATAVVENSGLHMWNPSQLRDILVNRDVAITPYLRLFSEGFSGNFSPKDAESLFQLVYLYMHAPRYDHERSQAYLRTLRNTIEFRTNNPATLLSDTLSSLLYTTPLVRPLTLDDVETIDLERAFQIYQQRFRNAADFNLVIVGDILPETLRTHLHWLARIPATEATEEWPHIDMLRTEESAQQHLRQGDEELLLFRSVFWGNFTWSLEHSFQFSALSDALTNRLQEQIREYLSAVYAINASAITLRVPHDYYLLFIALSANPANRDTIVEALNQVLDSMRTQPLTPEELARIKETQHTNFATSMQENGFWLNLLRSADLYNYAPQEALQRPQFIDSLTPQTILEMARRYLRPDNYLQVSVGPE